MERAGSGQRRQNRERMHRRSFGRKSAFGSARHGQLAHMPYSIVKQVKHALIFLTFEILDKFWKKKLPKLSKKRT